MDRQRERADVCFVGHHRVHPLGRHLLVQSRAIAGQACHHVAAVMMMMKMTRALQGHQTSPAGTMAIVLLATGACLVTYYLLLLLLLLQSSVSR